ncbi:MAG: hypothetical protein AYL28_004300 [Candidatus Bathyarchaeota archaeon B23]|nr:MAG: hypothetical protein AYL28_004300 [Candidatus Bathyarchaeota archaeon B23]
MGKLAVVKVDEDVERAVEEAVDLIGGLGIKRGCRAVLKPNICYPKNPYGMVITDFRVIEAVIRLLQGETDDIVVVESDSISGTADRRAERSGLLDLLSSLGVEFMNLSRDEGEVHRVNDIEIRLPKTVLEADYFVNLPKMKTSGPTLVTLSIKNLFGLPMRGDKKKLHPHLDEILPYLARVIRHDLIVVDAITAMEGNGPVIGTPKEMDLIIAGRNPLEVDVLCANMMGINPKEVGHLVRAYELGLGEIDVGTLEVVGEDWRSLVTPFERPYSFKASMRSIQSVLRVLLD